MYKTYGLLFLMGVLLFSFASMAGAHSVLTSSDPKAGSTVTKPLSKIQLTFDTKVEMIAEFQVIGSSGNPMEPEQVTKKGEQLTATFKKPLTSGKYTVKWQIVGADGHPVSGEMNFKVKAGHSTQKPNGDKSAKPEQTTKNSQTQNESEPENTQTQDVDNEAQGLQNNSSDEVASSSTVGLIILLTIGIILAVLIGLGLITKIKHS